MGEPSASTNRYVANFLLTLVIFCTGEQFEEPKVIGASLSLRTKERLLQVWLKDGRNERMRTNVSNKMRHFLNLDPDSVTLYYKEHQKSIKVSKLFLVTNCRMDRL